MGKVFSATNLCYDDVKIEHMLFLCHVICKCQEHKVIMQYDANDRYTDIVMVKKWFCERCGV